MIGFVDDSNSQTNDFMHTESATTFLPTTMHKLRHKAQARSDLLGASRGPWTIKMFVSSTGIEIWEKWQPRFDDCTRPSVHYPVEVEDRLTQAEHD